MTPISDSGIIPSFLIPEDDLKLLEALVPNMYQRLSVEARNDPRVHVEAETLKRILSDVRWSQGPYRNTEIRK